MQAAQSNYSIAYHIINIKPDLYRNTGLFLTLLNNDRVPVMYGMPKIHEKDIPIRPIVSSIGARFDSIAWIAFYNRYFV